MAFGVPPHSQGAFRQDARVGDGCAGVKHKALALEHMLIKAHAHRRRRVCAAQIATRLVCIEQYNNIGSKPERSVS